MVICASGGTCLRMAPTRCAVWRVRGFAFVELGVVPVHFGQGQDVGACGLESVPLPAGRRSSGCGTYRPG